MWSWECVWNRANIHRVMLYGVGNAFGQHGSCAADVIASTCGTSQHTKTILDIFPVAIPYFSFYRHLQCWATSLQQCRLGFPVMDRGGGVGRVTRRSDVVPDIIARLKT